MKVYRIYRYGKLIREINGTEKDLLEWIRCNVPPRNSMGGIRSAAALPRSLYDDAEAAGITINSKKPKK